MNTSINTCAWVADGNGAWNTSCRRSFEFNDGSPSDNSAKFCLYCGGLLVEVPYTEEEDTQP